MEKNIYYHDPQGQYREPLLLSLDPGPTTGYTILEGSIIQEIGDLSVRDSYFAFFNFLKCTAPRKIIFEEFYLYPRMTATRKFHRLIEVEIIGIVNTYIDSVSIDSQTHSASLIKNFSKQEVGKYFGITKRIMQGLSPHAFDALRHVFYYQTRGGQQ